MHRLNSSLRLRDPVETFRIAAEYCSQLGISRITETTWLDCLGIPVAIAIRPGAQNGSLIVTAGKGFASIEAKTGALMESIELAFSEEQHSSLEKIQMPATMVLAEDEKSDVILDLCPLLDVEIDLDSPMSVVGLTDLLSGAESWLPAELVFIPFEPVPGEARYFGYHTNGLASGNSFEEAVIHAIYEVIERDILSFECIFDQSHLLEMSDLPPQASTILERVENAGLKMVVKTVENIYGLPFFKAYVVDEWAGNPTSINAGYGCHSNTSIGLIRAMIEAVQSRMSYIQGSREDLSKGFEAFTEIHHDLREQFQEAYALLIKSKGVINLRSVKSPHLSESSIDDHLHDLLHLIRESGVVRQIFVGRHTRKSERIQVVKVIIPRLEFFNQESRRVGPRLRDFMQAMNK